MDEVSIEFRREGSPTDLWGTFRGFKWDFWAKYGGWEFRLSENSNILPEVMTPDDPGFFKNGEYGNPRHPFRQLSLADAERVIRDCLAEYAKLRPNS